MILFGAGGHAKVVLSILEEQQIGISKIYDDSPGHNGFEGYTVHHWNGQKIGSGQEVIITIGDNRLRASKSYQLQDCSFGKAISMNSYISLNTKVEHGSMVLPNATINASAKIGVHCIINSAAVVEHDCILDSFVHVAPNATVCGGCKIGEGTLIGAGAVIIPGVSIGKWVNIGAGAVVIENVDDNCTVVGNPGRIIKSK